MVSELDSVMEFGLSCAILLASRSLAGLRPASELVADLVSDLFAAGLRPARELVSWSATC